MRPRLTLIGLVVATTLAAACNATSPGTSSEPVSLATLTATQVPSNTAAPTANAEPTASPGGGGAGQPTPGAVDPCTLLTKGQASTLMGRTLSAGVSSTLDAERVCTWKNGLAEVKLILAPPAPDLATATAYWDAERAQVPAGVTVNDLSVFDRSAFIDGASAGAAVSALFVIDGTWFFDLYCGFPACDETKSVATAEIIVGNLP